MMKIKPLINMFFVLCLFLTGSLAAVGDDLLITPAGYSKNIGLNFLTPQAFAQLLAGQKDLQGRYTATPLAQQNALMVTSREEEVLTQIEKLARRYDINDTEVHYFALHNTDVSALAILLDHLHQSPQAAPPEPNAPAAEAMFQRAGVNEDQLQREFTEVLGQLSTADISMTPDTRRNSLIIRGPKHQLRSLLYLLGKLDQPSAQVMIDVYLLAVDVDAAREELGLNGSPDHLGEFSYQLLGREASLLWSALQKSGRTTMINRPQVITQNNIPVSVDLAYQRPMAAEASPLSIKLTLTPRMQADGSLYLKIARAMTHLGQPAAAPLIADIWLAPGQIIGISGGMSEFNPTGKSRHSPRTREYMVFLTPQVITPPQTAAPN